MYVQEQINMLSINQINVALRNNYQSYEQCGFRVILAVYNKFRKDSLTCYNCWCEDLETKEVFDAEIEVWYDNGKFFAEVS